MQMMMKKKEKKFMKKEKRKKRKMGRTTNMNMNTSMSMKKRKKKKTTTRMMGTKTTKTNSSNFKMIQMIPITKHRKKQSKKTIQMRKAIRELDEFDGASYVANEMTEEEMDEMDKDPVMMEVEKESSTLMVTENDFKGIDLENLEEALEEEESLMDAFTGPDAFPDNDDDIYPKGLTKEDMAELDESRQTINRLKKELAEGTIIENKLLLMDEQAMWESLNNGTQYEIMTCLDHMEHGGSDEPLKWLMFDLAFNVTNLILSSVKYNPEAPVLLSHWYPQLTAYERYGYVRAMDFDFTHDDVQSANLDELYHYWSNLGYDEPPKKHPSETGIVTWDREGLDDDERELAALENWYDEVYEEDFENHYFDDEDFTPEQNVFDKNFGGDISKESTKFMAEREDLEKQFNKMYPEADESEIEEHTDKYGRVVNYTVAPDQELEEQFRGHLVVATGPILQDVEIAASITSRMAAEFGKKVFVETRVLNHVREDDHLFEVWLESYEIDLLHSKRKATYSSQEWDGPSVVDDKQMDYLVERVGHLISDDFRYSYRMFDWDFVGQ
uniref:Uncharacterized protein n=1 Tax=Ditylum brightwellii TaxID=49249 RepID=A0A7S4W318_9STRA